MSSLKPKNARHALFEGLLCSNPSGAATQALCGRRRARELRAGLGFWKLWELGVWWRGGDLLGLGSGQLCVRVCFSFFFFVFLLSFFFSGGRLLWFFGGLLPPRLSRRPVASSSCQRVDPSIRSTCRAKEKLFSTVQAWKCHFGLANCMRLPFVHQGFALIQYHSAAE